VNVDIFLFDNYAYQEMVLEDDYLKLKTSLFVLPDFILGNHPRKADLKIQIDQKRTAIAYMRYLFCHDCLNRDFDTVAGYEKPKCCPICGSTDNVVIDPSADCSGKAECR